MTEPGWQPDPTGRFSHRWYDGNDWTDNVIGANGQPTLDPFPRDVAPPSIAPPPPAELGPDGWAAPSNPWDAPTSAPSLPTRSEWEPQPPAPSNPPALVSSAPATVAGAAWRTQVSMPVTDPLALAARDDRRSALSVIVCVLGLAAVAASLFVLDWTPASGFLDGRGGSAPDPLLDRLLHYSFQFGSFAMLALTALATAVVVLGSPGRGLRAVAAILAAAGAIVHTFTVVRSFRFGGSPELGAWAGTAGYLVVLIGLGIDAARRAD